jgi:hypothetical protein
MTTLVHSISAAMMVNFTDLCQRKALTQKLKEIHGFSTARLLWTNQQAQAKSSKKQTS